MARLRTYATWAAALRSLSGRGWGSEGGKRAALKPVELDVAIGFADTPAPPGVSRDPGAGGNKARRQREKKGQKVKAFLACHE